MKKIVASTTLILTFLMGCKRPETAQPQKVNESEFITSLKIKLRKEGERNFSKTLYFKDLDGEGGMDPVLELDELDANTVYFGRIEVLDESKNPTIDVTKEIIEEKNEHQFFFRVFPENFVEIAYQSFDVDDFGVPFGVEPKLTTKNEGKFNLEVDLRHQANNRKPRSGNGDQSIGASDILVVFKDVVVK